jgi:hypothetical protein
MTIKEKFKLGKQNVKEGNLTLADRMFDMCIVHLSKATLRGESYIEGASVNLWKTRVWTEIEKAGLLPE